MGLITSLEESIDSVNKKAEENKDVVKEITQSDLQGGLVPYKTMIADEENIKKAKELLKVGITKTNSVGLEFLRLLCLIKYTN